MTDFFDWLTAVDSGSGADRLRERFKLSEAELRRATEALAPAFLIALQQMTADRGAWTEFLRRSTSAVLPGADAALPSPGFPLDFAARLFGSQSLADSVTRQASMMAGIAPDTLSKMMPELGLMTLRTMMQMVGTGGPTPGTLPGDAGGQAMAEVMRRSANAVEAFSRPSGTSAGQPQAYMESLFADALKGGFPWMTGAKASARPARADMARTPAGGDPSVFSPFFAFAPLLEAIANPGASRHEGEREADATDSPGAPAPHREPADLLADMTRAMEAGRSLQETYAQDMLALFDRHRRTD